MASPAHRIERTSTLPVSAEEAFAWHEREGAFERLSPPWERLEVLERSGGIRDGAARCCGSTSAPSTRDGSRSIGTTSRAAGSWTSRSRARSPTGSTSHLLRADRSRPIPLHRPNRVRAALRHPGCRGGHVARPPAHRADAGATVTRRCARTSRRIARTAIAHLSAVAITGASGLIGSALTPYLTTGGHTVTPVTRQRARPGRDPLGPGRRDHRRRSARGPGRGGAPGRRERRRALDRRAEAAHRGTAAWAEPGCSAETLARLRRPPRVLVSASAMGIYGDRGDQWLTEDAVPDGPARATSSWSWAASGSRRPSPPAPRASGWCTPRFGLVLTPAGGALARMLPPFRLGVGGPIGNGRQWVSWISMDDADRRPASRAHDRRAVGPRERWPPRTRSPAATSPRPWAASSAAPPCSRLPRPRSSCSSARWPRPRSWRASGCRRRNWQHRATVSARGLERR